MSFGVIVVAIIFIGLIIYNTSRSNKTFSNKKTGPRRVTIDSMQKASIKSKTSNTVFYGRIKRQIIECEYQKQNLYCDMVLNINYNTQTVSCMELGNMKRLKSIKRHFNQQTKFIELSDMSTNETNYLNLHFKNNNLFSAELTNSKDTGFIYFNESIIR